MARPPYRHLVHRLRNPDEFEVAVTGVSLRADFLSSTGPPTRVEQFQSRDWAMDFHQAHVKARLFGPLPDDWVALGLTVSAADSSWYGFPTRSGVLMCNPPGEPIDGFITPGFSSMSVSIPRATWDRARILAGAEDAVFERFSTFRVPKPLRASMEAGLQGARRLLLGAASDGGTAESVMRGTGELMESIATSVWEMAMAGGPRPDSPRNRGRLARRAEGWMRDHFSETIRIPDVCLALRVSRRELEYAFRGTFDQSPREFLQALRLNAIRRALRRTDLPVTRIALDHGIAHLGRFAAQYRRLFGENPGETIRG